MEQQFLFALVILLLQGANGAVLNISNNCGYTIWPAISTNTFSPGLPNSDTGFVLPVNSFKEINTPPGWSGRIWARTICAHIGPGGTLNCSTGDCRTGSVECGPLPLPPVTFVDINSSNSSSEDSYDVAVAAGFNVPVAVIPQTGSGCHTASCTADVNGACPAELRVLGGDGGTMTIACMSACQALKDEESCCAGKYSGSLNCKPNKYTEFFKGLCPLALSYDYDQGAVYNCTAGANYLIIFCDVI